MPSRWPGEWKRRVDELGRRLPLLRASARSRQDAQARERAAEQRYRLLAEVAPVGIFHTKPGGECTYVSERSGAPLFAGLTAQEALGRGWLDAVHPDNSTAILAEWTAAVGEDRPFAAKYRFLHRDSTITHLGLRPGARRTRCPRQGRELRGTVTDISARHTADAALRASEEKFAAAFALSPQSIAIAAIPSRAVCRCERGVASCRWLYTRRV